MCKEFPGPRCSNHAHLKKDKAWKALLDAQENNPVDSIEVKKAQKAYEDSVEEFKSTPDGLAMLPHQARHQYQKTRDYQVEALNEMRNNRFSLIAQLIHRQQSFYDEQEVESVVESVRREEERKAFTEPPEDLTLQERKQKYAVFLAQQKQEIETHQSYGQQESKNILAQLNKIAAPKEQVTFNTYNAVKKALTTSQENLRREIQKIAVLQDVSTKVAEAYYDAYRNEYVNTYASLPKREQPNPPKEWVEGEFHHTGFKQDSSSKLIPTDPATLYAVYRLRSDRSAIPDYLKQSRIVASTTVDETSKTVGVVLYNNKGKKINEETYTSSQPHEIAERLRGRIIVMDSKVESRNWLVQLNKQLPLNSSVISLSDLGTKHLNTPDNSLKTFSQTVKSSYKTGVIQTPITVLESYFKARALVQAKWQSKSPRKQAATIEDLPLTSRWA